MFPGGASFMGQLTQTSNLSHLLPKAGGESGKVLQPAKHSWCFLTRITGQVTCQAEQIYHIMVTRVVKVIWFYSDNVIVIIKRWYNLPSWLLLIGFTHCTGNTGPADTTTTVCCLEELKLNLISMLMKRLHLVRLQNAKSSYNNFNLIIKICIGPYFIPNKSEFYIFVLYRTSIKIIARCVTVRLTCIIIS